MIRQELRDIIDEYHSTGASLTNLDALTDFLLLNDSLKYNDIAEIITWIDPRANAPITPPIISAFLAELSKATKAKSILNPFAMGGRVAMDIAEHTENHIDVVAMPLYESKILTAFAPANINVQSGNALNMDFDKKYDLVVSDLPFGAKSEFIFRDTKISDMGLAFIAKCIDLISEDGYISATFANGIASNQNLLKILNVLEESSLFINAFIDLPVGVYAPYTNIQAKIVIFSKKAMKKRFIARLTAARDIEPIIESFLSFKPHKRPFLGMFVDPRKYSDYSQYQDGLELKKLAEKFSGKLTTIDSIAEVKRLNPAKENEDEANSIFIPTVGVSRVVTSANDFEIKAQHYMKLLLDTQRADPRYVAYFFNTLDGIEIRQKFQSGTYLKKINMEQMGKLQMFLPDIETQYGIIETLFSIEKLEAELNGFRQKLYAHPMDFNEIKSAVAKINKDEPTLDEWIGKLPFPIASILRRYRAASDDRERREELLRFFEAFAQFLSTMFLSLIENSKSSLAGVKIFDAFETRALERASFGAWIMLYKEIAKAFRNLAASKDENDRQLLETVFASNNKDAIRQMCNNKLFNLLNDASRYRNKWHGHSAAYSESDIRNQISTLENLLTETRTILYDAFDEFSLVRAHSLKRISSSQYINKVDLLVGSNSEFLKHELILSEALVEKTLYIHVAETDMMIELIPLVQMRVPSEPIESACYFYSRVDGKSTRYVSYHYEGKPEIPVEGDDTLSRVTGLIEYIKGIEG